MRGGNRVEATQPTTSTICAVAYSAIHTKRIQNGTPQTAQEHGTAWQANAVTVLSRFRYTACVCSAPSQRDAVRIDMHGSRSFERRGVKGRVAVFFRNACSLQTGKIV